MITETHTQMKLSQTKSALKEIETQKEESISKFREQKIKFSGLRCVCVCVCVCIVGVGLARWVKEPYN